MREALRPLISLWIDTLVLRLLNEPMPDQKPVWFVIDELATLQRLPQLHTAITENRKSQNPSSWAFRGAVRCKRVTVKTPSDALATSHEDLPPHHRAAGCEMGQRSLLARLRSTAAGDSL